MGRVVIAMDPPERSATVEIIDQYEQILPRAATYEYRRLCADARGWPGTPGRVLGAVDDRAGIGG